MTEFPLGRRVPTDFVHVDKYPFLMVAESTVKTVEHTLKLPAWHWSHDQGAEGSCVGHGTSMLMSLLNRKRYNPIWLWNHAKLVDEWADTNPGDDNGTSVRAACSVLKDNGHVLWDGKAQSEQSEGYPLQKEGIAAYRWASTVDEMRTAISENLPVSIGINWYTNFDSPVPTFSDSHDRKIGVGDLGSIRGGHCVCVYGASDKRHAFRVKNSWGRNYPLVWLPYETMQRLLNEQGEACLITDR